MKYSVTVLCLVVVQCSGFVQQFPDSFYSSLESDPNFFPWLQYSEDEVSSPDSTSEGLGLSSSDQQEVRNVHANELPALPGLDGNRTYMDLFLCGQFMDLDAGFDYAVVTFDYAGYEVKFDPCEAVEDTARPINFIYKSGDASASADLKASQALPTMWRRFTQSNDGQSPRNIHFFSRKLPSKAAIKKLVSFVQHEDRSTVSFFLGYLEQSSDGRDFFKHIQSLLDNRINVMNVCGRCNYLSNMPMESSYRLISRYGMGRPNMYIRDGCPLIEPSQVPGEIYNGLSCDTFQESMIKCASKFITSNCELASYGVSLADVTHTHGRLGQMVYSITKTCLKSVSCWKEESNKNMKIFDELIPVVCSFSAENANSEIARCVKSSSSLPFDPNSPGSTASRIHFATTYIVLFIMAIQMLL